MAMFIEIYIQFIQSLPIAISLVNSGKVDNQEMELLLKETIGILQKFDKPVIDGLRKITDKAGE